MIDMKKQIIEKRLVQIQKAVKQGHYIFWKDHAKNRNFLAGRGWSVADVERIVAELTEANYYQGPEADRDGSDGEVWKYLHPSSGELIYIKMKLSQAGTVDFVKIMSFHKEGEH